MSSWGHRCARGWASALGGICLAGCTVPNPAYLRDRGDAGAIAEGEPDGAVDVARGEASVDGPRILQMATVADAGAADAPGPSSGTTTCPQRSDLALCVRFEGHVADESQYRHMLTSRDVSYAAGGPAASAADLGTTSLITVADSTVFDSDTITIEAWVKPHSLGRFMGIIDYNAQYGMFIAGDGSPKCVGTNGLTQPAGPPLTAEAWASIACVFDRTMASIWVDGVKVASAPRSAALRTDSTSGINLGSDNPDGNNTFDGLLDNVRVWRAVRTGTEICAGAFDCP
jgi:hypothetical protein